MVIWVNVFTQFCLWGYSFILVFLKKKEPYLYCSLGFPDLLMEGCLLKGSLCKAVTWYAERESGGTKHNILVATWI
jgi:hypothetical protein